MRRITVYILMGLSAKVSSLDITFPSPTPVQHEEAWKYGITPSKKEIESDRYFSIDIKEELLCPIDFVEAMIYRYENTWIEIPVVVAASTYGVHLSYQNSRKLKFIVHCSQSSNIHQNRTFSYEFSL
jgi:hypothetical protein